jgi:hypothetical protein
VQSDTWKTATENEFEKGASVKKEISIVTRNRIKPSKNRKGAEQDVTDLSFVLFRDEAQKKSAKETQN